MKGLCRLGGCWILFCAVLLTFAPSASAFKLNESGTATLSGSFQTRASIRTTDSGPKQLPEVDAGDWVQHRNLLKLELNHNLGKVGIFDMKYHLLGRAMYEGIYDYGPSQFDSDNYPIFPNWSGRSSVDDHKWDLDLWEGYIDVSTGPLHVRLGRQTMAWGETNVVRIMDQINPLDNTFGGIFEDLDDRRIPLWMIRAMLNLPDLGSVSNLGLEAFFVPGEIDSANTTLGLSGGVYDAPANPSPPIRMIYEEDDEEWNNSRYGIRLSGFVGGVNWTLGYQHTFDDFARAKLIPNPDFNPLIFDPTAFPPDWTNMPVSSLINYYMFDIFGGSFNYYCAALDMIFRGEAGYFKDVNMHRPAFNTPFPMPGSYTESDQLRYSLSIDKSFWVRWLTPKGQWELSLQYASTTWLDYEDDARYLAIDGKTHETESNITMLLMNLSGWMDGSILPQIVLQYDPAGIWFFQPSLEFKYGNHIRAKVIYSTIDGYNGGNSQYVNAATFKNYDQVTLALTFLF